MQPRITNVNLMAKHPTSIHHSWGDDKGPRRRDGPIVPPDSDRKRRIPTGFSGDLDEGLHAALPVVALRGQRGHVVPLHGGDDVHHGLGLVGVGRYHAGEEVVAAVVAELGRRRGVADLRDLRDKREESGDVLETPSPGL